MLFDLINRLSVVWEFFQLIFYVECTGIFQSGKESALFGALF